jgi:hypothetical protein
MAERDRHRFEPFAQEYIQPISSGRAYSPSRASSNQCTGAPSVQGERQRYDAANVVVGCGRLSFGRVQVTDARIQEQDATTYDL